MQAIPLDKLIDEWTKDAVINNTEPGQEITRIPKLHAKYVHQIAAHSAALKMRQLDFQTMKKRKIEYYSGRMDEATLKALGWEPFRFILKTDIGAYLDADDDLLDLKKRMINNEEAIELCRAVVKELGNRTYQISNFIKWELFVAGQ